MAAEVLVNAGLKVDIYDAMTSLGRKFLMAGKGGLNLTHAEGTEAFLSRYGSRRANLESMTKSLLAAGSKVVIAGMTLPPNYGPDYIHEFEHIFVQLAAKYKLPRVKFLLEGVALDRSLMQRDGIHANAKGNEKVAATVMATLEPLLKKR